MTIDRYEFDRIREKTGIDKLESTQRKKLFRDFLDHGGKVIEEPGVSKTPITGEQERTRASERPLTRQRPRARNQTAKSRDQRARAAGAKARVSNEKRKRVRLGDIVKIHVKGLVLKLFGLSGKRFTEKFVEYVLKDVKESFIDLGMAMDSFLKGDGSIRRDIYRLSIGENSTFYEFMVRMSALYNEREFAEIARLVTSRVVPRASQASAFKQLFLRLYVLGQFMDLCKLYIDKSLELQSRHQRLNAALVPSIRAQLRKDVNVILGDFMMKLHILICRIDRTFYPLYSQKLDDFLEMTEKDKIGYITREERKKRIEELKRQREYLKRQQTEIQEKELETVKPPKHVERGFPLLEASVKRYSLLHRDDSGDPLRFMAPDDKMYRSHIYLEMFDNEYSFILTTGKIAFNIDYREQKKVDIKEDLSQAYLLHNEAKEEAKDYIDVMREIRKTQENMRLTIHQKSGMLDGLLKNQSVVSRKARMKIADAMKAVENTLSTVISDYNSSNRLLQNPDEALYFDKSIDGDKKLHGKTTIEAIVEAFLFASAFAFLLNFGVLAGSGLRVEPETPAGGGESNDRPQGGSSAVHQRQGDPRTFRDAGNGTPRAL